MKQFKSDVMHWKDYNFTVVNDKVEKCYKEIINFIKKQKKQNKNLTYDKRLIKNHIKELIN